jgi:acyl CoA:acetate/3-ketoacid CoA transferase alpha subunit
MEDIAAVRLLNGDCLGRANEMQAAKIVSHIHHEMSLHIEYCEGFGMTKEEMEATEESQGTLALRDLHAAANIRQHARHIRGKRIIQSDCLQLNWR